MSQFYRQCRLKKGSVLQVAWIPEQFSVLGKLVKIKGDRRTWVVDFVSVIRQPEDVVMERQKDYRFQRLASDI